MRRLAIVILLLSVVVIGAMGCAAQPAEHSFVTEYQVVGDRTVKYIYRPGDRSDAGSRYLDQALSLEICSLESMEVEIDAAESADDSSDEVETRREVAEVDCRETRILKTEEYR